jgi:uracil-DNA glycosylase family 4
MNEPAKRGRGRPKKEVKVYPLHVLQGGTSQERMQSLYADWYGCKRCDLSLGRDGEDICFAIGNPDSKIMIIGEAPGEEEERTSIPFVGPAGQLLNQLLAATADDQGIQELFKWYCKTKRSLDTIRHFHQKIREWRDEEFFITNVVACRPPENRNPAKPEIEACWERVYNMIYQVDPWLIITLGKTAAEAVIRKSIEITQKRGQIFDVEIQGRVGPVVYPTAAMLHPSFLLRVADWDNPTGYYTKTVGDFLQVLRMYDHLRNKYMGTPIPTRVGLAG